mmetsp:Transcript_11493/g.34897  ORF Transcript_11493/g.34897 Transcript_11493/m.34897 type:complete len:223 (-) Transcript_11493:1575-2243(-)
MPSWFMSISRKTSSKCFRAWPALTIAPPAARPSACASSSTSSSCMVPSSSWCWVCETSTCPSSSSPVEPLSVGAKAMEKVHFPAKTGLASPPPKEKNDADFICCSSTVCCANTASSASAASDALRRSWMGSVALPMSWSARSSLASQTSTSSSASSASSSFFTSSKLKTSSSQATAEPASHLVLLRRLSSPSVKVTYGSWSPISSIFFRLSADTSWISSAST